MWAFCKLNSGCTLMHFCLYMLMFTSLSACSDDELTGPMTVHRTETVSLEAHNESEPSFRYLALGDSYTVGTGVKESERFPVQLRNRLVKAGYDMLPPEIIATNGWTTGDLLTALESFDTDSAFDLVSLLIGVNNQYQGRSLEEYTEHFDELLRKAITYAGNDTSNVFVISIPDYGVTPFAANMDTAKIAAEIDAFNAVNDSISNVYGVSHFYITDISRQAANDPSLVAGDNLHPSGAQYSLWTDLFENEIKLKLNE